MRWVLVALLAASLLLNAVLLLRAPAASAPAEPPRAPVAAPTSEPSSAAPSAAAPAPLAEVSPRRLAALPDDRPPSVALDAGVPLPNGPALGQATKVDVSLEEDVLCTVAERKMQEAWRVKRDQTLMDLTASLHDSAQQEAQTQKNAERDAQLLGLSGGDREQFIQAYRKERLDRVAAAAEALDKDPEHYAALFDAVRDLFAAEDALALRYGGEAGRDKLRLAEVEARTTALALMATLADQPLSATHW